MLWCLRRGGFGRRVPGRWVTDDRGDVGGQLLERLRLRGPVPPDHQSGLNPPETERRADLIDQHGDQHAALAALVGLLAHPTRGHRLPGPHDHHTPRAGERLGDLLVERLASPDLSIPPHGPAVTGQSVSQRSDSGPILTGVADEDVAHRRVEVLAESSQGPGLPGAVISLSSEASAGSEPTAVGCGPVVRTSCPFSSHWTTVVGGVD